MARWIDATPSQRFWQYTLPAARRLIEKGEWDQCIAEYDAQIEKAKAGLAASEPGSFDHRQRTRRLAELETYRAGNIALKEADLATIAEGERRKALKRGRAA